MGLNFSYLLYFKKEDLWHALDGLLAMAEHHNPPIQIHFPDGIREIPMDSWVMRRREVHHDDPEFSFASSLKFDWDEEIEDWLSYIRRDDPERAPPDPEDGDQVAIGYIYLTIYNDISRRFHDTHSLDNLVLFEFDTTGTRMSLLFSNSTAIRKAFIQLLENYRGVAGMFNWESDGVEMFWLRGQHLSEYIYDLNQALGDHGDPKLPG